MNAAKVYYLVQQLSDVPENPHWLSAAERARADGFRFPKRKSDWLLGRWTAKRTLCAYLALLGQEAPAYSGIEIRSAPDGAPEPFFPGGPVPASLALSHSGGRGFCAVSVPSLILGCDLENVRMHDAALVRDYFCEQEKELVSSVPPAQQMLMITLIWSAKESALKCLREGLRRDTRSVLVNIPESAKAGWNPMTVFCRESSRVFHGWWCSHGDHVLTIAAGDRVAEPLLALLSEATKFGSS